MSSQTVLKCCTCLKPRHVQQSLSFVLQVLPPHLVLHFSQANVSNGTFVVLILTGAEEKKRAWQPSGVVPFLFLFLITSLLPN